MARRTDREPFIISNTHEIFSLPYALPNTAANKAMRMYIPLRIWRK